MIIHLLLVFDAGRALELSITWLLAPLCCMDLSWKPVVALNRRTVAPTINTGGGGENGGKGGGGGEGDGMLQVHEEDESEGAPKSRRPEDEHAHTPLPPHDAPCVEQLVLR